jgi:RecB family endonuclease NucS
MNMKINKFGLVSVLYYKCYNASILGSFSKMEMYYRLLEDEYSYFKNKSTFQEFLDKEKMGNLKLIKQQLEMGRCFEVFADFEPMEIEIEMSDSEVEEEKLIVHHVAKNQHLLRPLLKGDLKLMSLEFQTGSKKTKKDRCDMVSRNDLGTIYPIEFKLNKATHAVVGQIKKYCLHFKLGLINQLYERVQGVVVAHSYSKFALNELKKSGHICLIHNGSLNNLSLSAI